MSLERDENKSLVLAELESERSKLKIKEYSLSVSELVNQYENKELIISPEYQRAFRWDRDKKSILIESMLLGLPIPPLFVAENEKGQYELIDGLQRSSTIISFLGKLSDSNKNNFCLVNCKILKNLNGYNFGSLPEIIQLKFKRYRLTFIIIENDSSLDIKYDMFKRLNSNSESLTDQEMRNCIYRGDLNNLLVKLAKNDYIDDVFHITDNQKEKMAYEELILKIIAFANEKEIKLYIEENNSWSDKDYLDHFMKKAGSNPSLLNLEDTEKNLLDLFELIKKLNNSSAKKSIFTLFNNGRFSSAHAEMLCNYLFINIQLYGANNIFTDEKELLNKYKNFMENKNIVEKLDEISKSSRKRSLERNKLIKETMKDKNQ